MYMAVTAAGIRPGVSALMAEHATSVSNGGQFFLGFDHPRAIGVLYGRAGIIGVA